MSLGGKKDKINMRGNPLIAPRLFFILLVVIGHGPLATHIRIAREWSILSFNPAPSQCQMFAIHATCTALDGTFHVRSNCYHVSFLLPSKNLN
jgi:hypothetical protein